MITPRRTRLVRVPDLHAFRSAIVDLSLTSDLDLVRATAVVVPTRGAARQFRRTCETRLLQDGGRRAFLLPDLVTRDQLYDRFQATLARPVRRLNAFERVAVAGAAARDAAGEWPPPFRIRPALVAEILRFYDQLGRQRQPIDRFEALLADSLARDTDLDRGAERMLQQTRFLAATFREYERRLAELGSVDEHTLRQRLLTFELAQPLVHIVVTVGDWIADPHGLYAADFDLLTRLPGLETIDVVATERLLASGFHQRLHDLLPGLEEVAATCCADLQVCPPPTARRADTHPSRRSGRHAPVDEQVLAAVDTHRLGAAESSAAAEFQVRLPFDGTGVEIAAGAPARRPTPVILAPEGDTRLVFEHRDREEELVSIARRLKAAPPRALDRVAVVFRRPLPYLYLARAVFGAARIPYETQDALPLAAEPVAAALDLLLDAAASNFTRASLVALLRSPHFRFGGPDWRLTPRAIAALDRGLSETRYLGELDRLRALAASCDADASDAPLPAGAAPALEAALTAAAALEPLGRPRPVSAQLATLVAAFEQFGGPPPGDDRLAVRDQRARATVVGLLKSLAAASAEHDDPEIAIDALAADLRRWLEDETFVPEPGGPGVQVIDANAARYGDFDDVTIVGLIEGEWPERPRRNIFYPPGLLATLGWPSEKDRRGAATAAFIDLVGSAERRCTVSTFTLDDEALVEPSILADEVERAGLPVERILPLPGIRVFEDEALSLAPPVIAVLDELPREWAALRIARTPGDAPSFHGGAGPQPSRSLSVSAIERYLRCPFQFFAQYVLRLEDEPQDDEAMDPKRQGLFIHAVFEDFFRQWQERGHRAIAPADRGAARELFAAVAERHLAELPEAEAAIERTRLLGSPVASGLGDIVFRMESERPVDVVDRLLEYELKGTFTFEGAAGSRAIALRGVADRIDLLADGTFRLIDYKLSSAPNKSRALQLPVYGLCAEQRLDGHAGRRWTLGEAAYIAFRGAIGAKRVVPLFTARADRGEVLATAQQRLIDAVDGIERGEFPPTPEDVFICGYCSYAAVCRLDYVGDV